MSSADSQQIAHLTPVQAIHIASKHAALLRQLYTHPGYKYHFPPTAQIHAIDTERTPTALLWVTQFVESTYVDYVLPFLPPGATRKCRDIANPWAYADVGYAWEWTRDAATGQLRDGEGNVVAFPQLGAKRGTELVGDVLTRAYMVQKLVLENGTDPKARLMIGGKEFDFGEETREIERTLDEL
jgi:hypothetical protein